MRYLNVGCGTHYATGWVNTDVWEDHATKPDVLVESGKPYPFEDNTFDAIFLGHVLEHMDWSEVGGFLEDMNRIAKPDVPILAVGPDVYRTIKRWQKNQEPWSMVESVMEHQDVYGGYTSFINSDAYTATPPDWWDGAAHHWNCHEDRMFSIMSSVFTDCSVYTDKITCDGTMTSWLDNENNITWPVVGYWHWQCAVLGRSTQ